MTFLLPLLVHLLASASRRGREHHRRPGGDVQRHPRPLADARPWPTLSYKGNDAAVVMAPMQAHTGTWSSRALDDLRRGRR